MGYRLPVFDIKVSAQKQNVYTKVSQNELALQFFKMGFFNPQLTDQTLMCLEMMDFDGKDGIMQKVAQNGTMFDMLMQYMQLAIMLAQQAAPEYVETIAQDMMNMGVQQGAQPGGAPQMPGAENLAGFGKEPANVEKARKRSQGASQPGGGKQ
jgi:hypothetical protein